MSAHVCKKIIFSYPSPIAAPQHINIISRIMNEHLFNCIRYHRPTFQSAQECTDNQATGHQCLALQQTVKRIRSKRYLTSYRRAQRAPLSRYLIGALYKIFGYIMLATVSKKLGLFPYYSNHIGDAWTANSTLQVLISNNGSHNS